MKNRQTKDIKLHPDCIMCIVNKYMKNLPAELDTETKSVYLQKVLNMIANAPLSTTPPEIVRDVAKMQKQMLGTEEDYTEIKYVKKPSGAKPGMVIYVNYNTIYANPDEDEIARLKKQ